MTTKVSTPLHRFEIIEKKIPLPTSPHAINTYTHIRRQSQIKLYHNPIRHSFHSRSLTLIQSKKNTFNKSPIIIQFQFVFFNLLKFSYFLCLIVLVSVLAYSYVYIHVNLLTSNYK